MSTPMNSRLREIWEKHGLAVPDAPTVAASQTDDTNIHQRDGLASAKRSPIGDTNIPTVEDECPICERHPCDCDERAAVAEQEAEQIVERAKQAAVKPTMRTDPDEALIKKAAAKPVPATLQERPETSPAHADTVCVLACADKLKLTKTWRADGTIQQYDDAKHFRVYERQVSSIHDVAVLMQKLAKKPNCALIRGRFVGAAHAVGEGGAFRRVLKNFHDQPLHFVMLDIDRFQPAADPVREPVAAIDEFITSALPECFHYRSYYWQLSSSAGHPSKAASRELRAHLVFWLEKPYTSGQLKAWKLARNIAVDGALFNPVQLHFVADPVLEDGVAGAVPTRGGLVEGLAGDTVALEIPANLTALVREHDPAGELDLVDPREKPGVIGAFCRAYTIEEVIERWLADHFEWETPGDPRRLNFADGGGAPGGAFVAGEERQYIVNKHNSDPFGNRAANKFDLVRHYEWGHLDDADDAFDADATNSTSYHRAVAELGALPEVQAELAKAREREAAERLEELGDTGADVLEELRGLRPEEVEARWLELAIDLGPVAEDAVLEEVARVLRSKKMPLKHALRDARAGRALDDRETQLDERAQRHSKARILVRPGDPVKYARQVEKLIVDRAALMDCPESFVRFTGQLCEVVAQELPYTHAIDDREAAPPAVPTIRPLSRTAIEEHIAKVAQIEKATENGPREADPDPAMVTRILELPNSAAPVVKGVAVHPMVLPSGSILDRDGLHEGTRLVLKGAAIGGCRVYSQTEAREAVGRLRETVLDGFEFASELDADVALAMLFTGVQRKRMDQAPAFMVLAAAQSSGKTTLARRIHLLLTGRDMPVLVMPREETEIEKRLFALLSASPTMLTFDNVADGYFFRSSALAAVLTAPVWESRVLGVSETKTVPTAALFAMTGNNLQMGRDELTRWATIRLAPKGPSPEKRQFRHMVVPHALESRARVLRDVVGVIAGWLSSGERQRSANRFPVWDRQVRQALLWAGAGDVAAVFDRNAQESTDAHAEAGLLHALSVRAAGKPFLSRDVKDWSSEGDWGEETPIRDTLEHLSIDTRNTRSIGSKLRQIKDRHMVAVVDGEAHQLKLESVTHRSGVESWRVVRT